MENKPVFFLEKPKLLQEAVRSVKIHFLLYLYNNGFEQYDFRFFLSVTIVISKMILVMIPNQSVQRTKTKSEYFRLKFKSHISRFLRWILNFLFFSFSDKSSIQLNEASFVSIVYSDCLVIRTFSRFSYLLKKSSF